MLLTVKGLKVNVVPKQNISVVLLFQGEPKNRNLLFSSPHALKCFSCFVHLQQLV